MAETCPFYEELKEYITQIRTQNKVDETHLEHVIDSQTEIQNELKQLNNNFISFQQKMVPIKECNKKMSDLNISITQETKKREEDVRCIKKQLDDKLDISAWRDSQIIALKKESKWLAIIGLGLTGTGVFIGYLI